MSDLSFGSLGFGAAGTGNLYRAVDQSVALATVEAAWAGGIRYYDTAPTMDLAGL